MPVLIASGPDRAAALAADRVEVLYAPDLLPVPRYGKITSASLVS